MNEEEQELRARLNVARRVIGDLTIERAALLETLGEQQRRIAELEAELEAAFDRSPRS